MRRGVANSVTSNKSNLKTIDISYGLGKNIRIKPEDTVSYNHMTLPA